MPTENRNLKNHARTIQYNQGIPYTAARRIAEAIHETSVKPVPYPKNPRVFPSQIPVGLDNDNLMPSWDISREGHLIVRGMTASGITSTLKTVLAGTNRRDKFNGIWVQQFANVWVLGQGDEMADIEGISRYVNFSSTDYEEANEMLTELVDIITRRIAEEEDASTPIVLVADYRLNTPSDDDLMVHVLTKGIEANVHVALGIHSAHARYLAHVRAAGSTQATVWLPRNISNDDEASALVRALKRSPSRHAVWEQDGEERIFRVFTSPSR